MSRDTKQIDTGNKNVDITKNSPTVVGFCAGYGGIERGLDLAGVNHRVLTYVEIEAFACANLVAKMETGALVPAPIWSNLKTFPAHLFRDRVDILTSGYPCQPFSAAGKRAGKDDPRHLWPYIRDHIETIRPVRCFFENVEGHISLGLREVIEDLESLGYKTAWGIFSASEVGAPHQRKRVYILANSERDPIREQSGGRGWENGQSTSFLGVDGETRPVADSASERCRKEGEFRYNESEKRPSGSGEAVANADSSSRRRGAVGGPQGDWESELYGSEEFVPDANSTRQQQSNKEDAGQSSKQPDGGGLRSRAFSDTDSERLEGGIYRSVVDTEGRQKQEVRRAAECSDRGSRDRHQGWASEPELGRVVDGCADRVDRLRLLGNGVVPQTAAKAWAVLHDQLQHDA